MATSKLQPQLTVPSVVTQNIAERKQKTKAPYDKQASKQLSEFTIGERVLVKPSPKNRSKPWIHGDVVNKPAPRSCTASTLLGLVRWNHTQIRKASTDPVHGFSEPVSIDALMQHQIHLSRWTTLQVQTVVEQTRWSSPSM